MSRNTGMSLSLYCLACGRKGKHRVRLLLVAKGPLKNNTLGVNGLNDHRMAEEQRQIALRLGRLLIPHPVTCPNCGAVNAYVVYRGTWLNIMWLSSVAGRRVLHAMFGSAVGNVHPLVAAIHYRYFLVRNPSDHLSRVRLVSCLSTGGHWAEAREQATIVAKHSGAPAMRRAESIFMLALLAGCENDEGAMKEFCRQGLRLCMGVKRRATRDPDRSEVSINDMVQTFRELLARSADSENSDPDELLRWVARTEFVE